MLWWFAQTTLIAGGLIVLAIALGRWKRLGPEARHALWLVVLIKFALPPVVAWPWSVPDAWPARAPAPAPVVAAVAVAIPPVVLARELPPVEFAIANETLRIDVGPPPVEDVGQLVERPAESFLATEGFATIPEPQQAEPEAPRPGEKSRNQGSQIQDLKSQIPIPISDLKSQIRNPKSGSFDPIRAILALWLVGSVAVAARRAIKVDRFHRSLADARPAPSWLVEETRAIAERVGVRPPPVLATSAVGTPLLWCLGRPRLILPEALIGRLDADRWPGILAHELAHLARRDHWVVRLELLVEAVWWWNPLFWYARGRLHDEAEAACDARVVRSLPERRFAYAEALVDVCEHLARSAIPSPALGVGGAGASRSLEGRLSMILKDPIPRRPTRRAALAVLILAALALPAWTLGQQPDNPTPRPPAEPPPIPKPPAPPGPKPETPTEPPAPPEPPSPTPTPRPPTARSPESPAEPQSRPNTPTRPDAPPALTPASDVSIDVIRAHLYKGRLALGNLAFRYVVVGRDRTSRTATRGGVVISQLDHGVEAGGHPQMAGPASKPPARLLVRVQAADVVLASNGRSRLDVLEASPLPAPGEKGNSWSRRLVAQDTSGIIALEAASDKAGPVPFRWLAHGGRPVMVGDSLAVALAPNTYSTDPDRTIDPFDIRPANVLDLAGATTFFLDPNVANAEVAGVDLIDGHEAVRVAWIANRAKLRGLCWLAPSLGFSVIRSDSTKDPDDASGPAAFQQPRRIGRLTWRKTASGFVRVNDAWLPGKVTYEFSAADPSATDRGAEPLVRRERSIALEDYRIPPEPAATAFHPKLSIQTLDDLSGEFTANPPELPAGLVDRLNRAVQQSPFGPPVVENATEEPPAAPTRSGQAPQSRPAPAPASHKPGDGQSPNPGKGPQGSQPGRIDEDIVRKGDEAPTGRMNSADTVNKPSTAKPEPVEPARAIDPPPAGKDPAPIDPKIVARPSTNFPDPVPIAAPRIDGPMLGSKTEEEKNQLYWQIQRRFKSDPEVAALARKIQDADEKIQDLRRISNRPGDPAERLAQKKRDQLQKDYDDLWMTKKDAWIAEARAADLPDARDQVELLEIRRNGKAAELRKAEAQRDIAKLELENTEKLRQRGGVGQGEIVMYQGRLKVAEAEVASQSAVLEEAELVLKQAKRRLGPDEPTNTEPKAGGPSTSTLPELRDAVELLEVQLQARKDEQAGLQTQLELEKRQLERFQARARRAADVGAVVNVELVDETAAKVDASEAKLKAKKNEIVEFEVRLKQAKRKAEEAEVLLRDDLVRAKNRLTWSTEMAGKGLVSQATMQADRSTYDQLKRQLGKIDPGPDPATPATPSTGAKP